MFIFHDRIVRFNLSSNNYIALSYYQTGLPFATTADLGFAVFSSGKNGFIYSKNDSKIISYCESKVDQSCTLNVLPCHLALPNCQSCDAALQICQACKPNYILINNTCFLLTPCTNSNCKTCIQNNYCL